MKVACSSQTTKEDNRIHLDTSVNVFLTLIECDISESNVKQVMDILFAKHLNESIPLLNKVSYR